MSQPNTLANGDPVRLWLGLTLAFSAFVFLGGCSLRAQGPSEERLAQRARHEFQDGKYAEAERDFREITNQDPSNLYAQFFLGQSLFRQQKFTDAVVPFEKARELDSGDKKLASDQHRILIDQLVIAYGISGNLREVHALLDHAIRQDPEYPLNYYNLACAFAGEGDKTKMLANLALAFQHKDHVIKGEQMPDPRTDDSFQKYVRDEDFVKLMKQIGYN
jgi:predicted Zn-dependent protease